MFHWLNRVYGRSVTPGCRRHRWGDLVVPMGWRRWGRSMDFPSFCHISLKELKGDSASSYSQGPTCRRSPMVTRWPTPSRSQCCQVTESWPNCGDNGFLGIFFYGNENPEYVKGLNLISCTWNLECHLASGTPTHFQTPTFGFEVHKGQVRGLRICLRSLFWYLGFGLEVLGLYLFWLTQTNFVLKIFKNQKRGFVWGKLLIFGILRGSLPMSWRAYSSCYSILSCFTLFW